MILSEKIMSDVCNKLNKISFERKWSIANVLFLSNNKKRNCIRLEEGHLTYLKENRNADKEQVLRWIRQIILNEYSEITKCRLTLYMSDKYISDYNEEDFINQPHIDLF